MECTQYANHDSCQSCGVAPIEMKCLPGNRDIEGDVPPGRMCCWVVICVVCVTQTLRPSVRAERESKPRPACCAYFLVRAQPPRVRTSPSDDKGPSADGVSSDGHGHTAFNVHMAKKRMRMNGPHIWTPACNLTFGRVGSPNCFCAVTRSISL